MNINVLRMINGKNIIGVGASRVVYDLGNGYVLKVAKSRYGITSNKKEVLLYKSAPSILKKYLGRIIRYGDGYSWIVMKRYSREVPKSKEYTREIFIMKEAFRKNKIIPYEVSGKYGPNYQNIRLKSNERIVVIDFGNFKFRKQH